MNKKKMLGILLLSSFFMGVLTVSSVVAIDGGKLTGAKDNLSFSTFTTATVEDDVSKFYREDWYYIENVEAGLMTLEVSWATSMDLDCYIATSASKVDPLASGVSSTANPETCSYDITVPGTYYIGIYLYTTRRVVTTPYTATVTYYTGGTSDPDVTAPTVAITAPSAGVTLDGTITITADAADTESGVDYVDCNFGGTNLAADATSPYSWTFDTTTIADGTYTITTTAYDNAGNSAFDSISVDVFNDITIPPPGDGEKIFVAFWASDAGTQANIDEYWAVLQLEGYTKKFDFKDTTDFAADFATVDAYENAEDTVFFYLFGHGNNNGVDSLTAFAPGTSVVYSSEMRAFFDTLEAERIGCLIESCHSGGFPLDFEAEPYLMMSTSDEDHNSYALATLPGEGLFSDIFFDEVLAGSNAVDAFWVAHDYIIGAARNDRYAQYPLIADYSVYEWFV